MKKMVRRGIALALTLLMVIGIYGCNMVVKNVERERSTVIATVGDNIITKGELDDYFNAELISYGYDPAALMADPTAANDVNAYRIAMLDRLVEQTVLKQQADRLGFTLTDSDKADARYSAQQSMESMREQINMQFINEADYPTLTTEEKNNELERRFQEVLRQQGTDMDGLVATLEMAIINDRMLRSIKGDVTVSEELLNQRYNEMMAEQKIVFTEDPGAYESTMNGYDIAAWQPTGFRRAKHILLKVSADEQAYIDELSKLGKTDEALAAYDAAMEVLLLKANEVKKQLDAGIPFDQLVEDRNEDSGMRDPVTKRRGYLLRKESSMVPEFIDAVFSMDTIGEYTDPVLTQFGYHIIQLTEIVEEGPVPLEDIRKSLTDELLAEEKERIWAETVEQWKSEYEIKTYPDRVKI